MGSTQSSRPLSKLCSSCSKENRVGASFCKGCRRPLCAVCGSDQDPDAEFCDMCGAPTSVASQGTGRPSRSDDPLPHRSAENWDPFAPSPASTQQPADTAQRTAADVPTMDPQPARQRPNVSPGRQQSLPVHPPSPFFHSVKILLGWGLLLLSAVGGAYQILLGVTKRRVEIPEVSVGLILILFALILFKVLRKSRGPGGSNRSKGIRGTVRGFQSRSEGGGTRAWGHSRVANDGFTIWTWNLMRIDESGNALRPMAVQIKGRHLTGIITDGDEIEIRDKSESGGLLIPRRVYNVTTKSWAGAK
jgi:hypothetical protein